MLSPQEALVLSVAFPVICSVCWHYARPRGASLRLPPGPKPLPVVGNVFDVSREYPWLTFSSMSDKYGDVMYLKVMNQPMIILGSAQAVSDLLDKRGSIYSDRPRTTMINDLSEGDWILTFTPHGERWRQLRRVFQRYLGPIAVSNYEAIQTQVMRGFLQRLLDSPENFLHHTRYLIAATVMKIIYGIDADENNEDVLTAEEATKKISIAGESGQWLVDLFPCLKYIPAWFPGAEFKRVALELKYLTRRTRDKPFNELKRKWQAGQAPECVTTQVLERIANSVNYESEEEIAADAVGVAFGAGVDTIVAYVQQFILAMVLHPEVQQRVQSELDSVVGTSRLPEHADRAQLPYTEAVLKEVLRWQPVAPMAVPHYTTAHDVYRGYDIPKGTLILGNSWRILHDPEAYPDPMAFKPERFLHLDGSLNPDVQDPTVACFGFGRRVCPGRYLSLGSLFKAITCLLHIYNVKPALDETGQTIPVEPAVMSGLIAYPKPFRCTFQPRSQEKVSLMRQATTN